MKHRSKKAGPAVSVRVQVIELQRNPEEVLKRSDASALAEAYYNRANETGEPVSPDLVQYVSDLSPGGAPGELLKAVPVIQGDKKRKAKLREGNQKKRQKAVSNYQLYRDIAIKLVDKNPQLRRARPNKLAQRVQGQAPRWRLTEVGLRGERPTHEFLFWDGVKFTDQPHRNKNSFPSGKSGQGVRKNRTPVSGKTGQSGGKVSGKTGQRERLSPSGKNGQNNLLPLGGCVGGALTEEEATNLTLPLMTVIDGGRDQLVQMVQLNPRSAPHVASRACAHCGGNGDPLFRFRNGSRPIWLHRGCRRFWRMPRGRRHEPPPRMGSR